MSFSIPPDDLIFGEAETDKADDEKSVSIKPITPKSDRKTGAGWIPGKDGASGPAKDASDSLPAPPPGLFSPGADPVLGAPPSLGGIALPTPPTGLGAAAGAPPPPPPPPKFNWAAPQAPPPPPNSPAGAGGAPGLILPDLNDNKPPPPGLPPSFPAPPPGLAGLGTATADNAPLPPLDSFQSPPEGFADQLPNVLDLTGSGATSPRTPLSKRPPARGRIHSELHLGDVAKTSPGSPAASTPTASSADSPAASTPTPTSSSSGSPAATTPTSSSAGPPAASKPSASFTDLPAGFGMPYVPPNPALAQKSAPAATPPTQPVTPTPVPKPAAPALPMPSPPPVMPAPSPSEPARVKPEPVAQTPFEPKPIEAKPAEQKPAEPKAAEAIPVESKLVDQKPATSQPAPSPAKPALSLPAKPFTPPKSAPAAEPMRPANAQSANKLTSSRDDKALPKPKSFGQLTSKKGPGDSQVSRTQDIKAPKQPGSYFTKIGEDDTDLPVRPPQTPATPRFPFPDDSMPAMQAVNEMPSWEPGQNAPGFDNLPPDDWQLDDDESIEIKSDIGTYNDGSPPSVSHTDHGDSSEFAPGASEFAAAPAADEHPAESNYDSFKSQDSSPFSGYGSETASDYHDSSQSGTATESSENVTEAGDYAADSSRYADEQPHLKLVEQSSRDSERSVPNSKQFREACLASSTADSAMGNENYKIALPLFKKAYKLFKKASATDSQEFGNCLHKLGDCFYHEEEFQEALDHYEEFVTWAATRGDRPDALTIVVNLKRARTFQKLDRLPECEQSFDTTVKMANQFLPVSHPLFAVVYNSYIAMMQLAGTDSERIKQVEEQFAERMMTSSRTVTIPQDLQEELSAWTDVEQADLDRLERQRQLRLSRQMFQKEPSKSGQLAYSIKHSGIWRTLAITAGTLVLAGGVLLAVIGGMAVMDTGDKKNSKAVDPALAPLVGKTYTSADGLKTVLIEEDGKAKITFGGTNVQMAAKAGPPKEGLAEDIRKMAFGKTSYILEQVEDGLKDQDGTILYEPDNKNLKIPKEMERIADLANYYFSRHQSKYPKKRKSISDMGADVRWENPIGKSVKPLLKAHEFEKYDGEEELTKMLEKYKTGQTVFPQDGKPDVPPGLIECLSLMPFDEYDTEDSVAFIVRSYDSNGKFLTSSLPGQVFVVCQKNGIKFPVIKPELVKSPIKDASKTSLHIKLLPTQSK
ncbi:MAG: hypothetical protein SGJ27_24795 [Candidatus Melainabacteria bacterium]|nr:hypothetical protein [Candidatus Melainabacteria bacterium]